MGLEIEIKSRCEKFKVPFLYICIFRHRFIPALPSSFLTQLLPSFGESELSFGSKVSAHSWQYLSHQGASPLPVKVA